MADPDTPVTPDSQDPAPPEPIDKEVLKRALKAFKKRLKATRLDEESKLGRGPVSGPRARIVAIAPPNQYPKEVWDALVAKGSLRYVGQGLYEPADG